MTKIIAVANQKGGVGKTTSTYNFAYALVKRGQRVLVIDADPQASLTFLFGKDERALEAEQKNLYYALVKRRPLAEIVIPGDENHPSLIPSGIMLAKADRDLMSEMNYSAGLLRKMIQETPGNYDVILIDCPPTLTILTSNALTAADFVLIPAKTDLLSIIGVPLLLDEVEEIRARHNTGLQVWGVLPTIFNSHYKQDQEALEVLQDILKQKGVTVFDPIPKSTAYDRESSEGLPTIIKEPATRGVDGYYKLADSLINHGGEQQQYG